MKTNDDLKADVTNAIKRESLLNAALIGVSVNEEVVTISGTVDSYAKKLHAVDAAKNVPGVKRVIERIEILLDSRSIKSDEEIAEEVVHALKLNLDVPEEMLTVKVHDGWITLEGVLHCEFQKEAANKSIIYLLGIKGVSNLIVIKVESEDNIEKRRIENALGKNWSIDNRNITVDVSKNNITLNGTVNSNYQKEEAGRMAGNVLGVWTVYNKLVITKSN